MDIKVKICCINSVVEAQLASASGAHHLGLVGPMPSGPGILDLDTIASITQALGSKIDTWLLTSKTTAEEIFSEYKKTQTTSIQLVDHVRLKEIVKLRDLLPEVPLVQVIHVLGQKSIEKALQADTWADRILLDSGNPDLKVKELGGTGRTHNWEISAEIVQRTSVPVYLAGGLNPDNVEAALDFVKPAGVDVCSGLRVAGQLDAAKMQAFFQSVGV